MALSNGTDASIGDNKEFAIAALSDVTIYLSENTGKTSADDTATERYFNLDFPMAGIKVGRGFDLRSDKTVLIVSMNGYVFTDPISVIINKGHIETFDCPLLQKMVIRTTVVNTNIKLRVK